MVKISIKYYICLIFAAFAIFNAVYAEDDVPAKPNENKTSLIEKNKSTEKKVGDIQKPDSQIFPYSIDSKTRREFLLNKQKSILLYWLSLYAPKTEDKNLNRARNKKTIEWEKENKIRLPFENSALSKEEIKTEKLFLPPIEYYFFQASGSGVWAQYEDEEYMEFLEDSKISGSIFFVNPQKNLLRKRAKQILKFWHKTELVSPEIKYDLLTESYENQTDEKIERGLEVSDDRDEESAKLSDDSLFSVDEARRTQRKKLRDEQTLKNFNSPAARNLMELYADHLSRKWIQNSCEKGIGK